MKKLNLTINCQGVYNSSIMVPDEMNFDEAMAYARAHLDEIHMGPVEYIKGSDTLDEDNCDFDDNIVNQTLYCITTNKPNTKEYMLFASSTLTPTQTDMLKDFIRNWVNEIDTQYQTAYDAYMAGTIDQEPVCENPGVLNDEIIQNASRDFFNATGILLTSCLFRAPADARITIQL